MYIYLFPASQTLSLFAWGAVFLFAHLSSWNSLKLLTDDWRAFQIQITEKAVLNGENLQSPDNSIRGSRGGKNRIGLRQK